MEINKKLLLYIGVFILFIIIGFGVSWLIKESGETTMTTGNDGGTPIETVNEPVKPVKEDVLPITIVVDQQQKNGNGYTLQVHAENVPKAITPLFKIEQIGRKSTDGTFTSIPGIQSGRYIVRVVDNSTGEELASLEVAGFDVIKQEPQEQEPTISKMSAGEFQPLLLNQNDNSLLGGKNPKVARVVNIRTQGLEEGDRAPGDILAVREKIANGIWASARVIGVGYDNSGRINSVTIQPVY